VVFDAFHIAYGEGGQVPRKGDCAWLTAVFDGYGGGLETDGEWAAGGPLVVRLEKWNTVVVSWIRGLSVRGNAYEAWGVIGAIDADISRWVQCWSLLRAEPSDENLDTLARELNGATVAAHYPKVTPQLGPALTKTYEASRAVDDRFLIPLAAAEEIDLLGWLWLLGPVMPSDASVGPPKRRPLNTTYQALIDGEKSNLTSAPIIESVLKHLQRNDVQAALGEVQELRSLDRVTRLRVLRGSKISTPTPRSNELSRNANPAFNAPVPIVNRGFSSDRGTQVTAIAADRTAGQSSDASANDTRLPKDSSSGHGWRRWFTVPRQRPSRPRIVVGIRRRLDLIAAGVVAILALQLWSAFRGVEDGIDTSRYVPISEGGSGGRTASNPTGANRAGAGDSPQAARREDMGVGRESQCQLDTIPAQQRLIDGFFTRLNAPSVKSNGRVKVNSTFLSILPAVAEGPLWTTTDRNHLAIAAGQLYVATESACRDVQSIEIDGKTGPRTKAALAECAQTAGVAINEDDVALKWLCSWVGQSRLGR
jgi:hypothetical protein